MVGKIANLIPNRDKRRLFETLTRWKGEGGGEGAGGGEGKVKAIDYK